MKIIERTLFRQNDVFNFFFEHLVDDEGNEVKEYFILEPKKIRINRVSGVAILPIVNNKIGMVEIHRPTLKKTYWELPHGFIDINETDLVSAIRELREETGIIADESDCIYLGNVAPDPGIIGASISVYFAQNGIVATDVLSELGLKRVKFFDMLEIKNMIDMSIIIDGITMATILKYLSYHGKIKWNLDAHE
jgi:8-oxo-dGTP pyrophosphatase MutT (NUDIX family)